MFEWSAKCTTPVQEYHLVVIRENGRLTFVCNLLLNGFCTDIPVIMLVQSQKELGSFTFPLFLSACVITVIHTVFFDINLDPGTVSEWRTVTISPGVTTGELMTFFSITTSALNLMLYCQM